MTEIPGTVVEFQASVFGGIQLPETVKAEDVQGNQYAVNYQENKMFSVWRSTRQGLFFDRWRVGKYRGPDG